MNLSSSKWLVVVCMLSACEVIADFDREKLDEKRTIGPTPVPHFDGSVAPMSDASSPDGALIGPPPDASREADKDASSLEMSGLDASGLPEVDPGDIDAATAAPTSN
ncbi:MAG TPA: hypothetical protein VI299_02745 [Polyangiales bacterium]